MGGKKNLIIIIYIFISDSLEKGAGWGGENLIKIIWAIFITTFLISWSARWQMDNWGDAIEGCVRSEILNSMILKMCVSFQVYDPKVRKNFSVYIKKTPTNVVPSDVIYFIIWHIP